MKKILVLLFVCASTVRAETFTIDPKHSSVNFRIRHIVSKVRGHFAQFEGSFDYTAGTLSKAEAKIDVASIDTGVGMRDTHLKSADFFDAEKCPAMTFKATKAAAVGEKTAKLEGELTMHCVTKPVVLDVDFGGVTKLGNKNKAGLTATAKVNRKDWGIAWNKALDQGGFMLGDDAEIEIDVEAESAGVKTP